MIQVREEYITTIVDISGTIVQVFVLILSPTVDTADEFNHYFVNVGSNLASAIGESTSS